ncbi:MAG: amino acid ABC transporter ATP-binding protein [Candidatus Babeliales bacterium]
MVNVNNLTVVINGKKIIDTVSCTLPSGRITCFLGKSGAGKTTLLKALAGLEPNTKDSVVMNGVDITKLTAQQRAQTVGFVFQDFNLFTHVTVLQNCTDPLLQTGMNEQTAQERALELLEKFGMQNFINAYPSELSGGQQQRVALARALCLQPQVLLLDEPTASLDPENTQLLVAILQALAAEGLTIGLSSQDSSFIKKIFDRAYFINQGTITESCETIKNISASPSLQTFLLH